jgi:hypothetical protein
MRAPLRFALLFVLPAAAVAGVGACGPNVILDGAPTGSGTGAGGGKGSTGTAFGGGPVTSSMGQGAEGTSVVTAATTVGTGGGFSGPASVTVGTGGGFGGGSVAAVGSGGGFPGTGGATVTSATSTGTGGMGACTDSQDESLLDGQMLYPILVKCAFANLGNGGGETTCIQAATFLSPACVGCVADDVLCSVKACTSACGADPNGGGCEACRNQSCAAAFEGCSGFGWAPGSTTCHELLFGGLKGGGWQLGVPAEAFVTTDGQQDYNVLQTCACGLILPEGCETDCDDALSNGPPDFCNGAAASSACAACLESTCLGQLMNCQAN